MQICNKKTKDNTIKNDNYFINIIKKKDNFIGFK
jgi:hypothetical protein